MLENYPHFPMDLIMRSSSPTRVLEVGVGAGFDAQRFCELGVDYIGIDKSKAAVELTKNRLQASNYEPPILLIDFRELSLLTLPNMIFERGVFHNQRSEADRESFVEKCAQLLEPESYWISIVGCADSLTLSPHGSLYLSNFIPIIERYFEILVIDRRRYGPVDWPDNFDAWYCLYKKRNRLVS